jgi:hypothetical protein
MTVRSGALVDAFSDSVGTRQAREIVTTAAEECGVGDKNQFSEDEAVTIAEHISERDDIPAFVSVSAQTLKTRIRLDEV